MAKFDDLAASLRHMIQSGQLRPGEQLPSTAQLMQRYQVSYGTVRGAMLVLKHRNWLRVGRASACSSPVGPTRAGRRSRKPSTRRRHCRYLLVDEFAGATKLRLHLVVLYAQITMRTPPAPEIPEGFPATEWTSDDVLRYLATRGRIITPATWYSYVSRGQAPQPLRKVGRTPVFDPLKIIAYADASTGPGRPRSE